jgi:hypothetical protein
MNRCLLPLLLICALAASSCKSLPEDRGAFAAEAGESTIVLGSCSSEWNKGWEQCLAEKGPGDMPTLRFMMMNAGEWAVSDCELGIYQTGSTIGPAVVEVDLNELRPQAEKNGFCILKIEAVERFPDPRDSSQQRPIPLKGGFFLEMVETGYFPTPSRSQIAFCVKAYRTTKGRTIVQACKN